MKIFTEENKYTIYVGENSNENFDVIDIGKKAKNALWFHVNNSSSGHTVLIYTKTVPKHVIKIAALHTKEQSKLKNMNRLTIIYTDIKNVKKTLKTGMVVLKKTPETIVV